MTVPHTSVDNHILYVAPDDEAQAERYCAMALKTVFKNCSAEANKTPTINVTDDGGDMILVENEWREMNEAKSMGNMGNTMIEMLG